ncbi:MAG: hypothetical protein OXS30_08265 [Chloroflexota bacterium]|nr:hypothetical protein [Chloroflexota bacterium]
MTSPTRTVEAKGVAMSTVRSISSGNLLDQLFRTVRRRSEAAESLLHTLCHFAAGEEVQLFAVGGLVRDILSTHQSLPVSPLDIDLAIDGDPAPFHAALASVATSQPTIHDRFGTASVSLADGSHIDLARTRSERYPAPGALPIVAPAPIEVDLGRRDFTVNAAALALTGSRRGDLIDPHDALGDLEQRMIRSLHRDSFRDDPTRLIRAARYAARIEGTIERPTLADARRDRANLAAVSPARFGDAWRLLLREEDPRAALAFARRLRISESREPRWKVPKSALLASDKPEQFWAAIGLLNRDPEIVSWLPKSVGMQRRERLALEAGAGLRRARRSIGAMRRQSAIARALGRIPDSALQAAGVIWTGAAGTAISCYLQRRPSIGSPISAQRLGELGVERGPRIGHWLTEIEAAIWDGELDPDDSSSVARMEQRIRLSR